MPNHSTKNLGFPYPESRRYTLQNKYLCMKTVICHDGKCLPGTLHFHIPQEPSAVEKGFRIQKLSICSPWEKRVSFSSQDVFALENEIRLLTHTKEINFLRHSHYDIYKTNYCVLQSC